MDEMKIEIPPVTDDPVTPLEFLETVYSCNDLPLSVRVRCAIAAAQYRHPKLMVTASTTIEGLAERLNKARDRAAGLEEARKSGKLIEYCRGSEAEPVEEHDPAEIAKPFVDRHV